jgi:hypothetical protein
MSVTAEAHTPGCAGLSSIAHALDVAPDPHDLPWPITITVVT